MVNITNRLIWIDLIKVFAMFSVVFLHSAAPILYKIGEINFSYWIIGNMYDSLVRMAVPLFFIVSGVLLLNQKKEPLSIFFKKRFLKVVIPLVVWSLIYILFKKYILHNDINILKHIIYSFGRPEYYHLWFLYAIIGVYLFLPILKIFIDNASQNIQIYFIVLWIISVSVIPFINYFTRLSINNYMPMMTGYVGYLVLGYQLSKITITKRLFYISIVFIIISTLGTAFGTYYLSEKSGEYIEFFYKNFSISTIIQASSYFIALKYIGETILTKYISIQKIITTISITSLGIYLIHPIYLDTLKRIGITVFSSNPLTMVPIVAILTFILSFMTIYFIQKIPIGKIITP